MNALDYTVKGRNTNRWEVARVFQEEEDARWYAEHRRKLHLRETQIHKRTIRAGTCFLNTWVVLVRRKR